MERLKRINKVDWMVLIIAAILVAQLDYGNLSLMDKVYMISLGLWVLVLALRVFFDLPGKREANHLEDEKRKGKS